MRAAGYELIVGVSVAVPSDRAGEAMTVAEQIVATHPVELVDGPVSNAEAGERELRAVFTSRHEEPTTADRLQRLREGVLLASCSRLMDPLYEQGIPCRILSWGCTDPQVEHGTTSP